MLPLDLLPMLLPVLIVSATLHELAHAYVARLLGDRTAEMQGRLTLNPIRHLDPMGSAMFLVTYLLGPFPIGWARPVPVHPGNFRRRPKQGMALVAVAGPITNFLIALAIVAAAVHTSSTLGDIWKSGVMVLVDDYATDVLVLAIHINLVLLVFNMFPIPPLDGSRVVAAFMPDRLHESWSELDKYGPIFLILLLLVFAQQFAQLFSPAISFAYSVLRLIVGG